MQPIYVIINYVDVFRMVSIRVADVRQILDGLDIVAIKRAETRRMCAKGV